MKGSMERSRRLPVIIVVAILYGLRGYDCCNGATLLVYNNNDAGAGSLRQAIADNRALGGGNLIVFSNVVTGVITLTSGELSVSNSVNIVGPGPNVLTMSGNNASRVLNIEGVSVSLSGLTMTFGRVGGPGGAIFCNNGNLTLNDCILTGNRAANGNVGGAVAVFGNLAATNCILSNNSASSFMAFGGDGGAIYHSQGALNLVRCSVLQNQADSYAALYCGGTSASVIECTLAQNFSGLSGALYLKNGTLNLESCTVFTNRANAFAAGVHNGAGVVQVRNTVIGGNKGAASVLPDCLGAFVSSGYNFVGAASGSAGWGALGDQTGTTNNPINPLLSLPQPNPSGPPSCRPLAGSPLLDQGKNFGLIIDQRGHPRTYDVPGVPNATGGDGTDIGAMEVGPVTLVVSNNLDAGLGSLRQTLADASALDGDSIIFAPNVVGTIHLTNGPLGITDNATITGPGARALTLSANGNGRVVEVLNGTVSISGLTLANGYYAGSAGNFEQNGLEGRGGGVFNQAVLSLNDCILSNNVVVGGQGGPTGAGVAGGGGNASGGAILNIGTLKMTNCYLVANSAHGGGGGVASSGGFDGNGGQGYGGGVFSPGLLTMFRCGVALNTASGGSGGGGAGSGSGGGIYNEGTVALISCTVASNSISGNGFDFGGGIYNNGLSFTIRGSTIAGNHAAYGGGMWLDAAADLGSSIVAYNQAGTSPDCGGSINSSDYNLIQNTNGATITGVVGHNLAGLDPQLGLLADNGGSSPTMVPREGSPVMDKGNSFGINTDQRGAPRPFDFLTVPDAPGGDGSDIGAVEIGRPLLTLQAIGPDAVLTWPAWYGDFVPEFETGGIGPNTWQQLAGAAVVSGDQYLLNGGPISGNQFFRLRKK